MVTWAASESFGPLSGHGVGAGRGRNQTRPHGHLPRRNGTAILRMRPHHLASASRTMAAVEGCPPTRATRWWPRERVAT
jgi:hypothetical protein